MSNKINIFGRLTRDPEVKVTETTTICRFSVADNRKYKGEEKVQFHRVTAFGKQADIISEYMFKGSQINLWGRLEYSQYEKDGETKYSTDIILDNFDFVGGRKDATQDAKAAKAESRPPVTNYAEDIPF